ncbi:ParB/RepB/Spo0J family partition protein [Acinetobacter qingfengensis]|uniref:Probable chromosome-partitioning protein ParB n=1 Tax=Acinetobacter qingfengensis TaxID=1262585 RepID=A0A1E7RFH2_9GAMM|nr:ParB/RepB/Spo0J family partition protein [Acinetobacter qingfengensis]KAA8735649.1 ParB/RepB/Spo0J family partition protein [Acinetobacter qingfengensis]OEY97905.1 chromosome partitioning protein [Acinetobacter qingfengensis]
MTRKRGLAKGRGLDALLGSIQKEKQTIVESSATQRVDGELQHVDVALLQRGEYQPRRYMGEEELQDLADSIKQHGVMQPIVIRKLDDEGSRYEIIAGERRWRAAQLAGLTQIPAIVREISDQVAIALALIENIQRQDLNPMEQALALQRFHDEFGLSHQEIADTVGKARATVSNLLRLLSLEDSVKDLLSEQKLDMGHARAILALKKTQQRQIAEHIIKKDLSVRQTEQLVRELLTPSQHKQQKTASADLEQLTTRLSDRLGAQVQIDHNAKGKGKIVIKYHSLDELDGILSICLSE